MTNRVLGGAGDEPPSRRPRWRSLKRLFARQQQGFVLAAGLIVLAGVLQLSPPTEVRTYSDTIRVASGNLKAQFPYVDIATTILGLRAMLDGRNPYVPLTEHFERIGIRWDLPTASTHPPTTFLFVAPLASLSLQAAVGAWAWLMLAALCLSFYLLGFAPRMAVGLGCLSLLWPPVAMSLGQLTIVWLLGIAMALRYRGAARGASIAVASMTKLVPALLLLPLLLRRRWRDVGGFAAAWAVALLLVVSVSGSAIWQFVSVNSTNVAAVAERADNASPLVTAYRVGGVAGAGVVMIVVALVTLYAMRRNDVADELRLASYLAVLILPIAWVYSACALIPVWLAFLKAGPSWRFACVGISVYILTVGPHFGSAATIPIASALLLPGVGLLVDVALGLARSRAPLLPRV